MHSDVPLARMRALQPARKATGSSSTDHDESNQPQLAIGQLQQNKIKAGRGESRQLRGVFDADDDFDFEDRSCATFGRRRH